MPTLSSRVTLATSVDSFSQTITQAGGVVLPAVTPLLPAQVLRFTRRRCCHLQDDEGKDLQSSRRHQHPVGEELDRNGHIYSG